MSYIQLDMFLTKKGVSHLKYIKNWKIENGFEKSRDLHIKPTLALFNVSKMSVICQSIIAEENAMPARIIFEV